MWQSRAPQIHQTQPVVTLFNVLQSAALLIVSQLCVTGRTGGRLPGKRPVTAGHTSLIPRCCATRKVQKMLDCFTFAPGTRVQPDLTLPFCSQTHLAYTWKLCGCLYIATPAASPKFCTCITFI